MGEVLGRYHIISELGRGGMGVVYKALDPKLERFIAIKCLSDELSEDEIVVARFLREARNAAALNHPNIAQIFVADEHDGKPYFVMEYVDGESLAEFIDREGQCSPEMARRVTEQAARALAAAADEDIVHRDVKPGNIMIDRRGRAVLTDFGIACITTEQSGSGSVMGTPGYMAPEVLSAAAADSRSDMFALGAVWFEMLVGERLMPGRDLKAAFSQLAKGGFPDLSALEGRVDDRIIDILGRMLAVQPENRYGDWSALLADMQPLKTGRTGPVERSDSGPSTAEREVTEALATTGVLSQAAAPGTIDGPEATDVLQTQPEPAHPVPVQQQTLPKRRGRWLAALLVLVIALSAAGFGLARLDSATWNRVTAWLPGSDEAVVTTSGTNDAGADPAAQQTASREGGSVADAAGGLRAGQAIADGGGDGGGSDLSLPEEPAPEGSPGDAQVVAEDYDEADTPAEDDDRMTGADDQETAPAAQTAAAEEANIAEAAAASDQALAMVEAESSAESIESASSESATSKPVTSDPVTSEPASQAEPLPRGVVVIGVGDPVVADPMVREIESALRGSSHPLVQRSFVSGYRNYIQDEEVDLAGLAGAALDAGARYVVVARALPAGERELQYYNRIERAFIAQLEAVTFDLHSMHKIGASPVEQIEFTSLNATRRAVDSVRPWLPGIRDQFD